MNKRTKKNKPTQPTAEVIVSRYYAWLFKRDAKRNRRNWHWVGGRCPLSTQA